MQILNLIRLKESTVKYNIINFPDGEPHIVLGEINRKEEVNVICRVVNPSDLYILMQVGDILNRQAVEWNLYIAYLMSMRMDRVICLDESFSLGVVASIIEELSPNLIEILEPHSNRTLSLLGAQAWKTMLLDEIDYDCIIVHPDEGAFKRYRDDFSHRTVRVYCTKIRDTATGKLSGFNITNPDVFKENLDLPIVVVDDLCDGGGTFAGIAKEIRKYAPSAKLSIYVTHMVNPNGIITLSRNYDEVTFTNSYCDWDIGLELPDNVKVFKVV